MSGPVVKSRIVKTTKKTPCNTENYVPTIVPSLSSGSSSSSAASLTTTSSSQDSKRVESTQRPVRRRSKQDRRSARGNSEQSHESKETDNSGRSDLVHDLPEWLEEIHRHYPEPRPKVEYVFAHFPKDRNCEVFKSTKTARALCIKRTGNQTPRSEKFDDFYGNTST